MSAGETVTNTYFSPALAAMMIDSGHVTPETYSQFDLWTRAATLEDFASSIADASKDDVTGLWNMKGLHEFYNYKADAARRHEPIAQALFVLMVDIEAMGAANMSPKASYAAVNNNLLVPFSRAVEFNVDPSDTVGKSDGDEIIVVGQADYSVMESMPERSNRFALGSLSLLVSDHRFSKDYGLGSAGIITKAALIPATTEWKNVTNLVDPKVGMGKGVYDYSRLPEGAILHRVYTKRTESPFGRIGLVTSTNEGGYFVPFSSTSAMSRMMGDDLFVASDADGATPIAANEIPRPNGT